MPAALKYGYLAESILEANREQHPWLKPLDARLLCRLAEDRIDPVYLGNQLLQGLRRLELHHLVKCEQGKYRLTAWGWQMVHEAHTPAGEI